MYTRFIKRFLDILLALIGMPILGLAVIVVSPIIAISDRGTVFYNADRVGKNGKIFKMYKFRSMKCNAPDIRLADGSTYNAEDDSRVTKVGRILRKTSIDELPQLLNVLLGDMSFVGPRPNLPEKSFEELSEAQQHRLLVRPGITGYNQAYFRNSVDVAQRTANDNYYVDHVSFLFDVKIFIHTFISVIRRDNIYVSANK